MRERGNLLGPSCFAESVKDILENSTGALKTVAGGICCSGIDCSVGGSGVGLVYELEFFTPGDFGDGGDGAPWDDMMKT